MSRLRRIAECDRIFFVTTYLSRNVRPFSDSEYGLLLRTLDQVRSATGLLLIGHVRMPDHVHLLFVTRLATMPHQFKFKSGYAVQRLRQWPGPLWQPRYFDFICRRRKDVTAKLFYIHQNPVTRNLVQCPDEWKWSSAAFYTRAAQCTLQPDLMDLCGDPNELLWLSPYHTL
jgi:REP element-mobilizing transposase RayT